MDVETGMRQVREAVENTVGTQNYSDDEQTAYRQAMEEVETIAGESAVEELVGWISGEIRESDSLPSGGAVEERAAQICRDHDEEIPSESRLSNV